MRAMRHIANASCDQVAKVRRRVHVSQSDVTQAATKYVPRALLHDHRWQVARLNAKKEHALWFTEITDFQDLPAAEQLSSQHFFLFTLCGSLACLAPTRQAASGW